MLKDVAAAGQWERKMSTNSTTTKSVNGSTTNRDNGEAESMNEETSAGAPPRVQARGQDAAMQTETATRTDRTTRRQGRSLAAVRPPEVDAVGSRVEGAAREGLTAPEVLTLALVALVALVGLGSMMLVLAII
jgi:hypothetical protein